MYICKGCFSGLVVGSYVTWDGLVRRRSCAFLKKGWAYNVWKGFASSELFSTVWTRTLCDHFSLIAHFFVLLLSENARLN